MLKRSSISLAIVAVIIVALFAATEVMAQCDIPTSCTITPFKGAPFTLKVYAKDLPSTCPTDIGTCYKWIYEFVGNSSGIGQIVLLAPDCCGVMNYSVSGGGQVIVPGSGDSTTSFGIWSGYEYVIRLAYSPSSTSMPENYSFYTDKPAATRSTSMQIKMGNSLYYCKNIAGPACPVPGYIPLNNVEEKKIGNALVKIERDRGSWCAARVYVWQNDAWVELSPATDPVIDGQSMVTCGTSDGNQRCQECIIYGESSPGTCTIRSGNLTFKVPC